MSGQTIVDFARTLIGSHYIWGAAGDVPGKDNGAPYRRSSVQIDTPSLRLDSPSVFAAQCHQDQKFGKFVCAGRFAKPGFGGRYASTTDRDYIDYLEGLKRIPQAAWQPFYLVYSPRKVQGGNVSNNGLIVWGEDCRNKRHFDCIGFINYVLSYTTTVKNAGFSIKQFRDGQTMTQEIKPMNAARVPGDIVVRGYDHIGFLTEKGGETYVIQAQDHTSDVHEDEKYDGGGTWDLRLRVLDMYMIDKPTNNP